MITFQNIHKSFRIAKRNSGFGNAVKALFSREYETVHALTDASFSVDAGEMIGYIGPNGAGKSTSIKIMCGILTPDAGECIINGYVPWKDRKKYVRDIGVVFGQRSQLWWDVPVMDSFDLIKAIYQVDDTTYQKNRSELTELLDLGEILRTPTRNLSLGQRMRCEIAAALLHNPKILFLDEPTIGLDALSKIAVRQFIQQRNKEKNTTVILTTHDMQDIEALTNRIILIGKGRILLDSTLPELKNRISSEKIITLDFLGVPPKLDPRWHIKEQRPGRLCFAFDTKKATVSQVISQLSAHTTIQDLSVSDIRTEEMVASLYTEYRI